jgi:hypothetical protein
MGVERYWATPTLFWLDAGDLALRGAALAGCLFSILLFLDRLPRLSLIILFLLYLSLVQAGQLFFNFQWDFLLLEAGFLAIFLPHTPRIVIWLFRWLLFRLRFLSGASKLISGDPTWAGFTALHYYFETQPIPNPLSWYVHQLPDPVLRAGVALVFFVELVVPFMMFLPRGWRLFAAASTIFMQVLILLTSNHNFFNPLTIVLCLFLLDDRALERLSPRALIRRLTPSRSRGDGGMLRRVGLGLLAAVILVASSAQAWELFTRRSIPEPLAALVDPVRPFHIANRYHVFPTIKQERLELIFEGSNDAETWKPYRFAYKVGDPARRPPVVVPHQPRLDWMLWFAPARHPLMLMWVDRFAQRLLAGAPAVIGLLETNPFPEEPPRYIRISLYSYRFASPEARKDAGPWWEREHLGPFFPLGWFERPE